MAEPKHVKALRKGPKAWNRLRNSSIVPPDLSGADLHGIDFRKFNMEGVNFTGANLQDANFTDVMLGEVRWMSPVWGPSYFRCHFTDANLTGACMRHAELRAADFTSANLTGADLASSDLREACLRGARLINVDLEGANLSGALLSECDVSGANSFLTVWGQLDLSNVKGLSSIKHNGPSVIGVDTLFQSRGTIPQVFLRGCGVPEVLITYEQSLVSNPIEFYSCFISYSTRDESFATRLHNDFQMAGIRCWKWDHDARTGRSLWGEIDQSIRKYDMLVLIVSEASLSSPAVNREIERALLQEDERGCDVLFPVRIDEFVFAEWQHERKVDVTKKVIADAVDWDKDNSKYEQVLSKLLRDLRK